MTSSSLQLLYGNIDIYLFDQLLKGHYNNCQKVIDVGCGGGRNLVYFLNNGFEVYGIDPDPVAINAVKALAERLSPTHPLLNFRVSSAEDMPFGEEYFDLLICSAVLHFADNEMHFKEMLLAMWKVIKPGGFFFARLASVIGIEELISPLGNGRYLLPDGTARFLVNEQTLLDYTNELNGYLYEPIKTTNVQNLRCMTTWCLQKL
ncbi:Methyltransferase type 11 [Pedobacter cryoconitis]|uniref:Methyltransferase type 11 n=1 Tax=Pedobacter cryoconitis TaxID=188932 RepID=A0A127VB53_9SPHI|nr:class I SAM-dependent methyltransferase [Pedobacter cryoconitis]AMP98401.1 Methyltransferase type 11 [Pedobacter cryoconitis]